VRKTFSGRLSNNTECYLGINKFLNVKLSFIRHTLRDKILKNESMSLIEISFALLRIEETSIEFDL